MAISRDCCERWGARDCRVLLLLCFAVLSASCGRIGFELTPSPSGDGDGDAGAGGGGGESGEGGAAGDSGEGGSAGNAGEGGASGSSGMTGGGDGDGDGDGDMDGGVDGGGPPGPVDVCVLDTCASDFDRCPNDPEKTSPGICGCDVSDEANEDGDSMPDCIDMCAGMPDVLPDGSCGCAAAAADLDGDGVPSCMDWCPDDGDKTEPLVCGCDISEADDDDDGMPTCADPCSMDPEKVVPGVCGCGVVESDLDTDGDENPDCSDSCNGVDDASYVPDDSCGAGYCNATNTASMCADGVETACMPGSPLTSDDATCDLVDDDCDGVRDDEYPSIPSSCGVGACARTGTISCVSGEVFDSCAAAQPAIADTTCDGADDDCDTNTDEDFSPRPSTCGAGACASTGTVTCAGGAEQDSCTENAASATDATCDGIDDDCDGENDEDYGPTTTTCGTGACSEGGITSCVGGNELDSCVPGNGAANDTTCDGVDDDCSGAADEDYVVTATSCGTGLCAATGQRTCVSGSTQDSCAPSAPAANDASCNGIDNDCSGTNDEDYVVTATSCGVGSCVRSGQLTCVSGAPSNSCTPGAPAANDASCDGVDQDCSGAADDDYVATPTSCGVGACQRSGSLICSGGSTSNTCVAGTATADNDCDGVDDDCDGSNDEHYVPPATSCGVGACGRTGVLACVSGSLSNTCMAGAPAVNDTSCNGVDNDCNGMNDEDYVPTATSCGMGACMASGQLVCTGGSIMDTCSDGSAGVDNDCDGVDDDCDGPSDEHFVTQATSCGVGACAASGQLTCAMGVTQNSCAPGTPAANDASCDNVDNDCNGTRDEDYVPTATSCGVGACAATGQNTCVMGSIVNTCAPGTPAANDASCDNVDNDCSGVRDEDYVPTATSCGVGACAASGQNICSMGSIVNTCSPGTPAANDASCNDVDNDCNGQRDEDYVVTATSCGTGACSAAGQNTCVMGSVVNSCTPGTPAANDASCDNVDNDCNGQRDEDYVVMATSCGVGACAASGQNTCVMGSVVNSCTPGTPAADDASCNNVDNDCNGQRDEDYVVMATSCGVGACAASGQNTCVMGSVVNSCTPGTPAANDATCNNIDEDCNGTRDEDYAPTATSCGLGQCAAMGQNICSTGSVVNTCTPGAPRAGLDDPTYPGNGVDNNCNGAIDEDSVPPCSVADGIYSTTGLHNITVPAGCTMAVVRLWGAGGASGNANGGYYADVTGGLGGPGGYVTNTFTSLTTSTTVQLRIGGAGTGCGGAGANVNTIYSGGAGSTSRGGNGTRGNDGVAPAGAVGGTPSTGGDGGTGYFGGGGGGGGGGPAWNPFGSAGGGGAASAIIVGPMTMVAGGGGGGGGAGSNIASAGFAGGAGGSGCSIAGGEPNQNGGGGGGGGKCVGGTGQAGSGRNPHVPAGVTLPPAAAVGGINTTDCAAGGAGYAIIDWQP